MVGHCLYLLASVMYPDEVRQSNERAIFIISNFPRFAFYTATWRIPPREYNRNFVISLMIQGFMPPQYIENMYNGGNNPRFRREGNEGIHVVHVVLPEWKEELQ